MRSVRVIDGDVVCPKCGARNNFVSKRTGKAKLMMGVTVGLGALAAPKRLKCSGCGTNLKRGSPHGAIRTQVTGVAPPDHGVKPPDSQWSAVCPNGHTAYFKTAKKKIVCSQCKMVKDERGWH